jgi:hypothetical protein
MHNRTKRLLAPLAGFAALLAIAVGPAQAQRAAPIVIDGVPYALPKGAADNVDAVRVLIAAAQAQGMIRNIIRVVGDSAMGIQYRATGTMGGESVSLTLGFEYRLPALRLDVTHADKSRTITIASGNLSWDETTPGVFLQAGKTSAAERLLPLWLMPPFVIHEGALHPEAIKVSTRDGMRQLTVPAARYNTEVTATLNKDGQIIRTEMTVGGKAYSAEFSDYQADLMPYHVYFPHRIVEKVDGAVVADLTLSEHLANPYMIWPVPQALASK